MGKILSRFFLVQALATCTMTIWPGPQLSIARAWARRAQKRAWMGSKWPKTSKICPKTRIIGEILSRFFLVQALGTYTMTIWPGPQLSLAWAWDRGAQNGLKGVEWAQNDQKLAKYAPKTRIIGEILSKFFLVLALGTWTMTIWPGPQLSIARTWVRGAQKGLEWAQIDQTIGKYVPKQELSVRYFQDFA